MQVRWDLRICESKMRGHVIRLLPHPVAGRRRHGTTPGDPSRDNRAQCLPGRPPPTPAARRHNGRPTAISAPAHDGRMKRSPPTPRRAPAMLVRAPPAALHGGRRRAGVLCCVALQRPAQRHPGPTSEWAHEAAPLPPSPWLAPGMLVHAPPAALHGGRRRLPAAGGGGCRRLAVAVAGGCGG